jgi:hypothetical protein
MNPERMTAEEWKLSLQAAHEEHVSELKEYAKQMEKHGILDMSAVKNLPPMGRRAAIAHTRKKNAEEDS